MNSTQCFQTLYLPLSFPAHILFKKASTFTTQKVCSCFYLFLTFSVLPFFLHSLLHHSKPNSSLCEGTGIVDKMKKAGSFYRMAFLPQWWKIYTCTKIGWITWVTVINSCPLALAFINMLLISVLLFAPSPPLSYSVKCWIEAVGGDILAFSPPF